LAERPTFTIAKLVVSAANLVIIVPRLLQLLRLQTKENKSRLNLAIGFVFDAMIISFAITSFVANATPLSQLTVITTYQDQNVLFVLKEKKTRDFFTEMKYTQTLFGLI
jgi:hypothetical protein